MAVKKTTMLRQIMESKTVQALGAQNVLTARLIEMAGFDAVYLSGLAASASYLGKPDMSFMTLTERLQIARNIAQSVELPVIADAEEGYGNAVNVMETTRRYEEIGVAAIHIDDEVFPCKCAFLPDIPKNKLISTEEMCGKISAAVEARHDPDFMIIARSNLIGTVSKERFIADNMIEEAIQRCRTYLDAGADMLFMYCVTQEQLELCAKAIKAPLMTLGAESERTYGEMFSNKVFEDLGYRIVIYPLATLYTGAYGIIEGLKAFQKTGNWQEAKRIDKDTFDDIIRTKGFAPLYDKYKIT